MTHSMRYGVIVGVLSKSGNTFKSIDKKIFDETVDADTVSGLYHEFGDNHWELVYDRVSEIAQEWNQKFPGTPFVVCPFLIAENNGVEITPGETEVNDFDIQHEEVTVPPFVVFPGDLYTLNQIHEGYSSVGMGNFENLCIKLIQSTFESNRLGLYTDFKFIVDGETFLVPNDNEYHVHGFEALAHTIKAIPETYVSYTHGILFYDWEEGDNFEWYMG